jgi:hypothetical protein
MPALILFPRYGGDTPPGVRPVGKAETFVRLTQASTNYGILGLRGFEALTRLVTAAPACAIDYGDTATGLSLVDTIWSELPQ